MASTKRIILPIPVDPSFFKGKSWVYLGQQKKVRRQVMLLCQCKCGTERWISTHGLKYSKTTKCNACAVTETNRKFKRTHGENSTSRLYYAWKNMKARCYNPKHPHFNLYGGAGIEVCPMWRASYVHFRQWAHENGYRPDLTLDRIDGKKGYSPGNCRWATIAVQNRNKKTNRNITYRGHTFCMQDWAWIVGISPPVLMGRLNRGWPLERALNGRKHGTRRK